MSGLPKCHKCKRAIRPTDSWRVNDAGYKVHTEGECRGPYAKVLYMVGYKGDKPGYLARMPDYPEEIAWLADEIIGLGFDVHLRPMNLAQTSRIVDRIQGGRR